MRPATDGAPWRCVRPACAAMLPHRTRFCPYCGAAQDAGVAPSVPVPAAPSESILPARKPVELPRRPASAAAPPAAPAARRSGARGPSLRTLLWIFFVLLAAWVWLRPSRLDKQVERAATMAAVCQTAGARTELARLKEQGASPRQLARIEHALDAARPACAGKQRRVRSPIAQKFAR